VNQQKLAGWVSVGVMALIVVLFAFHAITGYDADRNAAQLDERIRQDSIATQHELVHEAYLQVIDSLRADTIARLQVQAAAARRDARTAQRAADSTGTALAQHLASDSTGRTLLADHLRLDGIERQKAALAAASDSVTIAAANRRIMDRDATIVQLNGLLTSQQHDLFGARSQLHAALERANRRCHLGLYGGYGITLPLPSGTVSTGLQAGAGVTCNIL
jgi:hypothetical protein